MGCQMDPWSEHESRRIKQKWKSYCVRLDDYQFKHDLTYSKVTIKTKVVAVWVQVHVIIYCLLQKRALHVHIIIIKLTPLRCEKGVQHWSWPITGKWKYSFCMSCPFTRVSVRRGSTVLWGTCLHVSASVTIMYSKRLERLYFIELCEQSKV